jgi:hypothetical protein
MCSCDHGTDWAVYPIHSRMAASTHATTTWREGEDVERVTSARADGEGSAVDHASGGRTLERAMNHVNNFPGHLVCMVHTAPGQGRVICVTPHNESLTELIRKDFA